MSWNMDGFMPAGLVQSSSSSNMLESATLQNMSEEVKAKASRKQKGEAGNHEPKRKRKYNTQKRRASNSTDVNVSSLEQNGEFSRSGSIALNQSQGISQSSQGIVTPTNRRMSGASVAGAGGGRKASRGSRGGRESAQADGRGSKGSRGTSARASQSVNPAGAPSTQPQGEEGDEGDGGDGGGIVEDENDFEEDDEEVGIQDLEEDERDRQEELQRKKSAAMGPLMRAMDEVQLERYRVYRTSMLDKKTVKRLINHLTSEATSQQVVTLTAGIAKVFVGEMVERARKIQAEQGDTGPLHSQHLTEANRQYRREREVPGRFPPGMHSVVAGVGGNGKRRRLF